MEAETFRENLFSTRLSRVNGKRLNVFDVSLEYHNSASPSCGDNATERSSGRIFNGEQLQLPLLLLPISSPTLLPFLASSLHRTRKVERPNSREQADPVSHDSSIMSINRTDTTRRASTSKRLAKIGRHTYCFVRKDLHVICTWLVTKRGICINNVVNCTY